MQWQILPNGNLEITVDEAERRHLQACQRHNPEFNSDAVMRSVLEPLVTDDVYCWAAAEWLGALTEAPILVVFDEKERPLPQHADSRYFRTVGSWEDKQGCQRVWYTAVEQAWWFEPYAVRSPLEDLAETGHCVFQKLELEK